jgi:hypothetical protein
MDFLPLLNGPAAFAAARGEEEEPEAEETTAASLAGSSGDAPSAEQEVFKVRAVKIVARFPAVFCANARAVAAEVPHLEACENHQHKRWVMGIFTGEAVPDLRVFAADLGILTLPFVVGRSAGQHGEVLLMYQALAPDTHKPKLLPFPCVQRLTFVKRGGQAQKVLEVLRAVQATSSEFFGSLAIAEPVSVAAARGGAGSSAGAGASTGAGSGDAPAEASAGELVGPGFEEILAEVLPWGTNRLMVFAENAKIKRAEKTELSLLESRLLVVYPTVRDLVRLHEDSSDMVMRVGSVVQQRACPLPWASGSSEYARNLEVHVWNNVSRRMDVYPLSEWLDSGHYFTTSLLLLGQAAIGKSRVLHMLSQEIAISRPDPENAQYAFGKGIDPLGVLAHSGALRACTSLALTDFDLAAARGKVLTAETVKSLFDISEGGVLQECRWRACTLAPSFPRLFALNGEPASYGSYFAKYEQPGLALAVTQLEEATDPRRNVLDRLRLMQQLCKDVSGLGADDQAALRRVGIAVCRESMITTDTATSMQQETAERARAARLLREAFWAKNAA